MTRVRFIPAVLLVSAFAAACDPRGISVGTEDLCVADPKLTKAQEFSQLEAISNCARIGKNLLINPSFESPTVNCQMGTFCQFPAAMVSGWSTSSEAQVIEIWHDQYNKVPADDGSQFVELDAQSQDTLWQDLMLPASQLMYWSLRHRGRSGIESIEVRIGPPDATTSQGVITSAADAWYSYSGLYRVGAGESITRLAIASRTGVAEGNLIDAVVFAPVD